MINVVYRSGEYRCKHLQIGKDILQQNIANKSTLQQLCIQQALVMIVIRACFALHRRHELHCDMDCHDSDVPNAANM
jgi:hypothetical protein